MSLQRGKHRIPTILSDDMKYALYKFPKNGMPIPHDLDRNDSGWGSLREATDSESDSGAAADTFTF